jgi:AraC family transcriptional regulator
MSSTETMIASIDTPTTRVEVNDALWERPAEATSSYEEPLISMCLFPPGYRAEGRYLTGSQRSLSPLGRVIFVPHNIEFHGRGTGGPLRYVRCIFNRAHFEQTIDALPGFTHQQLSRCLNVQSALIPTLLSRLMREAMQPSLVSTALAETLGNAILIEWCHSVLSIDTDVARSAKLLPRHLKIIEEYLANLNGEAPSVSVLAKSCGLSERYFAKLFREHTGQPIGQYLHAVQIQRAQEFLLGTDLPLKEVAHRLGYCNPSNFSSAFRAATGQPPGVYRMTHRTTVPRKRITLPMA